MAARELIAAHAEGNKDTAALTLEKPFAGGKDAVELAGSLTTIFAVLILLLVIVTVFYERRWGKPPLLSPLRFTSLCVFPLLIFFFGSFATLEGSKRTGFCHSCHSAMDLYVDDMRNTESTTLAAVHYNKRLIQTEECYSCHSDYGVWGTAEAKARGLVHLYYWFTNAATARGEEQIALYGSYQNSLCLFCHAGSQSFLASGREVHRKFADALLEKKANGAPVMSCMTCHGPAHPKLADKKNKQTNAS
jgi:cytochrome c nitrite reductase small subunit